ncbi:conserved hypothetical protein [Ricinus communis]|uniref:FAF domain-containing protein n=1 Tax=Ricinus communis TaxID=3988 RepID=B9S252_RICCO|nr:conserved hypothetical protein [Ricinus communis]
MMVLRATKPCKSENDYPPPAAPWRLVKMYSSGRLIFRAETKKHHECFEVHRTNGWLTLNLVSTIR